jgi:hypothetical protein
MHKLCALREAEIPVSTRFTQCLACNRSAGLNGELHIVMEEGPGMPEGSQNWVAIGETNQFSPLFELG